MLTSRVQGNPYSSDGSFAKSVSALPPGLRAMAATHWLDISLTLDSITWHFGNFGEPGLVIQTEEGLQELGLEKLAAVFRLAKELMTPLIAQETTEEAEEDPYELLDRTGNRELADDIDRQAWALTDLGRGRSLIYETWFNTPAKIQTAFSETSNHPSLHRNEHWHCGLVLLSCCKNLCAIP